MATMQFAEFAEKAAAAGLERDKSEMENAFWGDGPSVSSVERLDQAFLAMFSDRPAFAPGGVFSPDTRSVGIRGIMGRPGFIPTIKALIGEPSATAEEIHAAFEEASGEEEKRARRILDYKRLYPSNPFLTKDQVKALCLKYDLVMAPDFMFAGEIPKKNRAERTAFKLKKEHEPCSLDPYKFVRGMLSRAVDASPHRGIVFDIEMAAPSDWDKPWLMVANTDFALYCPAGAEALWRWMNANTGERDTYRREFNTEIPAIPIVKTEAGFVRLHPGMIRPERMDIEKTAMQPLEVRPTWARFSIPATTVRFRFAMPEVRRSKVSYTEDVCQMVVCPVEMLYEGWQIDTQEGWEATFAWRQHDLRGQGADPLILQPVDYGYLVVTKWDAEALLPEVAGQTN